MLVVSGSLEKINLTVFDANITPYEHTSLYPSYRCLYSLALAAGASSELKKAVCFVETQEVFAAPWLCIHSVCVRMILRICQLGMVLKQRECVCVSACVNKFFCLCDVLMRNTKMTAVSCVMTV